MSSSWATIIALGWAFDLRTNYPHISRRRRLQEVVALPASQQTAEAFRFRKWERPFAIRACGTLITTTASNPSWMGSLVSGPTYVAVDVSHEHHS